MAKQESGISKDSNFSEWFTEIIREAELADSRFNVKGFLVFQPWSVLCMEKMYDFFEKTLQLKGHKPYWFPAVIPEENFYLEKEHVKGFAPEVFWLEKQTDSDKEGRLALRPTSETAFYKMFSLWIQSHKDLPLKTYQRAQVWRHETKATRPFIRSREFYWIETHCAFKDLEGAMNQVKEDMEIVEEVMHKTFGIPFIFFQRPDWDKFAGGVSTYGSDTLMPDGKALQLPSTHLIGQQFPKSFGVSFKDEDTKDKTPFTTCFGPAVSRIFAALIAVHSDNKGLKFPFSIASLQIIIIPIGAEKNEKIAKEALNIQKSLTEKGFSAEIDLSEKTPGNKFYYWEMKGVPFRIELGGKELEEKKLTIFRRDTGEKKQISGKDLISFIEKESLSFDNNLRKEADKKFKDSVQDISKLSDLKNAVKNKKFARASFCSIDKEGEVCAEKIEKEFSARVRGIKAFAKEKPSGKCIVCGAQAKETVYIAREY